MPPRHPAPIDRDLAEQAIAAGLAQGADFAEVFNEYSILRSLSYEEGKVKSSSVNVSQGIAVRAVVGESQGLAFCETGRPEDVLAAARSAAAIATAGVPQCTSLPLEDVQVGERYIIEQPLSAVEVAQRIALAERLHGHAMTLDPQVAWVSASLVDSERWFQVAASDGTWAEDYQPMVRGGLSVLLQDGARRERGYKMFGLRSDYGAFERHSPEFLAEEAVRLARFRMDAEPCPAGTMPVVLAAGGAGVLVHEAVGHGLEADFNRKGVSAYSGRLRETVASELVSIVDEGVTRGERGALNIDDEGTPVGETELIDQGVLRGYLTDKLSARLMDLPASGSGRRESYQSLPIPRMRITRMKGGQDDPEAIIKSVDKGLYAVNFGGGSVDISKGDYNFEVTEAYLIEGGKITRPVRGATLVGNGPETLCRVTAVGHDEKIDLNAGTCGKDGQGAPVSFGTPTFKVSELVVGGEG